MKLPEDVASALTDGVVLCHLANQVHPRSVVSIHVPSPSVVSFIVLFYRLWLYLGAIYIVYFLFSPN